MKSEERNAIEKQVKWAESQLKTNPSERYEKFLKVIIYEGRHRLEV